MAISLPDARQLSDEVLEALRLRALRGCELGFTETESPTCSASPARPSAAGGRPTPPVAWSDPRRRTGRPVGSGRTLSDEQARHIQRTDRRPKPRGPGYPRRRVDPQGRARPDPQGVRDRHAGADRRRVPQAVGLHGQGAAPPCQGPGPRGGRRVAGGDLPGDRERAAREDAEIHWCDETGAAADEQPRTGLRPRGEPARMEVPDPHIRMNQIATISNEGAVHFLTYKETMTAALFITFLEELLSETTRKVFLIVDRLPAHEAQAVEDWVRSIGTGSSCSACRGTRPELNAGGVPEQRPEGVDQRGGPAGEQGGAAVADRAVHEQVAPPPGARSELLPASLCPVRCRCMICDHLTCRRSKSDLPAFRM